MTKSPDEIETLMREVTKKLEEKHKMEMRPVLDELLIKTRERKHKMETKPVLDDLLIKTAERKHKMEMKPVQNELLRKTRREERKSVHDDSDPSLSPPSAEHEEFIELNSRPLITNDDETTNEFANEIWNTFLHPL